jgi:general secretion pathway protein A
MYSDHYGFSERPFQLTPDPRFWFESQTHRKAMAYLGYGLAQGEGFIVITGDIGAGKTTLVGHLLETIDRARFTAINIVSTQVEGDDMLRLVAQGLGLTIDGAAKAQLLDRVERTLDDQARLGKHVLIIVDEAQNLPTSALEELRMLSNYQVGNRSLVQIFLLGQPEFRDRLRGAPELEQLRQRVIATHHLDPMSEEEIGPYILHRLNQVGYAGVPAFSPAAFEALYNASNGVPRILNTLMARVLLNGALENLLTIDEETVAGVVEDAHAEASSPVATAIVALDAVAEDRIGKLEARVQEQEAALRRVLGLLVSWVEADADAPRGAGKRSDAA